MIDERIVGEPVNKGATVFYLLFGLFILLSGVLGNGFLLLVLATQRKLWEVHNIFIANLALADLVVVCSGLPFLLLDLLLGYQPVVNEFHCEVNGFILCLAYSVSILSLVSISFNRYMKVCHYNLFLKLFTAEKTVLFCLGLWVLGKEVNAGGMGMALILALPMVVIGYFNYAIFRTWRQSRLKVKGRDKKREGVEMETKGAGQLKSLFYVEFSSDSEMSSDVLKNTCTVTASSEMEMMDCSTSEASSTAFFMPETAAPDVHKPPVIACASNKGNTADNSTDNITFSTCTADSNITAASSVSNLAKPVSTTKPKEKKNRSLRSKILGKGGKKEKKGGNSTTSAEVALIRSLLVISICLFALYTPYATCVLVDYGADVPSELMVFVSLLLFVNCAVNWVIYGAMNTSFRQGGGGGGGDGGGGVALQLAAALAFRD
nr:hypothetical protein BaRGS_034174 [Batillaria attramentaria]